MSAEFALAIVSVIDLCLKYGKRLTELCKSMKTLHQDLEDLLLRIESAVNRTSVQLQVIRRINAFIDEEHFRIQEKLLRKLSSQLSHAIEKIEPLQDAAKTTTVNFQRVKYALFKEDIKRIVDDIEAWQNRYDPAWFLVALLSSALVDKEMQQIVQIPASPVSILMQLRGLLNGSMTTNVHVNLAPADFNISTAVPLEFSTVKLLTQNSGNQFLLDSINSDMYYTVRLMKEDTQALAKRLKVTDAAVCGLLKCLGLVKEYEEGSRKHLQSIHLVFPLQGLSPMSLRAYMIRGKPPGLSQRLAFAKSLAKSVSFVHVCKFVHKSIRPETIVTTTQTATGEASTFLLGFNGFRSESYQTLKLGEVTLEKNLYRHPSRQGMQVQDTFTMPHDIYSLGVVLLEIGLWASFFDYSSSSPLVSNYLGLDITRLDIVNWPEENGVIIKNHLTKLAEEKLPSSMGSKYTAVVVTCLTCLDSDGELLRGVDLEDGDGIVIGVRYIEQILLRLDDISL